MLWSSSANGSAPTAPGAATANLVGPPSSKVLRVAQCKPTLKVALAWVPDKAKGSRFLTVSFDEPPTGASVESVAIYLLNIGTLSPLITSVQLMVVPAQGDAAMVTIFDSATAAAPSLVCPGISHFAVSNATVALPEGWTAKKFNKAVVKSVRFDFNGTPVRSIGGMPYVAAAGLLVA